MDAAEILVNTIFLLLFASITAWIAVYRRMDPKRASGNRYYRWHQVLIGLIALLSILLAVVIVLSSDPGEPGLYLNGY